MRHRCQRIDKEDQHVDFTLRNHRANLLIAAQWPAFQPRDIKTGAGILHPSAGGSGCDDTPFGKGFTVLAGKIRHVVLFLIVSNQGDALFGCHAITFMS
ncbi:hypothetical protein D3C80_1543820 [compost metagenome]